MKTRLILLSTFLTPFRSGAEACAEEVALRLAEEFDITIVTARLTHALPEDDPFGGKVKVRRVGLGIRFDKWLFPLLAPFVVWRLRPQIVHAVLESYAGLAMMFTRLLVRKSKFVLTCQSTNTSFLVKQMHRSADRVTVISAALLKRAQTFGRTDALLIPNGVDIAAMNLACERHPKVKHRILFVGRLEPMKGVDVLLKAFARINPAFPAVLRVVGSGSERGRLEKMARELQLSDRVTFTGYVPSERIFGEYAEAEIFCGLSRSEALGNVFLEAQAAECAVIATHIGGIPDIVEHERTGLLVQPDDVEGALQALERLLADARLRETLTQAAHEQARTYDWSGIAKRYAEVYRSLL